MNNLHVLPNGDGIDLRLVTAVKLIASRNDLEYHRKAAVRVEHESSVSVTVPCESLSPLVRVEQEVASSRIDALTIPFDTDEAALAFRDELIKLVNSKGQATWRAEQIEAAPDGSGFGDWYQRYRVWNRDKTVVLLHTDVLKDAIEFLNKAEN